MSKKRILASAIFAGGLLLAGCGGTDTSSSPSGATQVAGYITDAPADTLAVFEVTLYEIRLSNGTTTVTLFSDSNGVAVDLTDLKGVMKYIGSAQVSGNTTFTTVEIVVGKDVNVKDANGNTATVSFGSNLQGVTCDQATGKCTIKVDGLNINVSNGKVAIDFDLKGFEVDVNNRVISGISIKHKSVDTTKPMPYELTGVVKSVGNNSFVITWRNTDFTVNVDQNTVCEGMGANCMPQKSWCVEVEGSSDPASSSTILALELERKKAKKCIAEGSKPEDFDEDNAYDERKHKLTGVANISVDTNASTITIDGTTYHIGADSVCKMESEGMSSMSNDDNNGGNSGNDDHNQNNDEDRDHQALQQRYKKGSACLTAVNQMISNLQNAQNQPTIEIEVKVSKDQNKPQNHVVRLEIDVEHENE